MKRTLLAGTFYALAGAATLLLAASIFYSCRSGGHPHHERNPHDAPAEGTHSVITPQTTTDGMRLTLASNRPSSHQHVARSPGLSVSSDAPDTRV